MLPPDQASTQFWEDDLSLIMVLLDREMLDHTISQELGRTITRSVDFDPVVKDPGIVPWLLQIGNQLNAPMMGHWRVRRDIERSLLTMLLAGVPNSESDNLAQQGHGLAPYYIRRAEAFIRENAREALTIDAVAKNAGVSPRSLFYGFKRWRNTTPMAFARDARLDIARSELENARARGGTVSQAATDAGFTDLGQFARLYKARFHETPSATLKGG